MMNTDLLTLMLQTPSVSGYENAASQLYLDYLKDISFRQERDALNNAYAYVGKPDARLRVMVEAHIDEIGFQVLYIDKSGFIYFRKNGGIDPCCVPGRFVQILTIDGQVLQGVIGKKPIHLLSADERKEVPAGESLWIDTGLPADEVKRLVHVGDPVCYVPTMAFLGQDKIASKGLDDKIGVFVVAEALRRIATLNLDICVCGVASSQEEVGCRGAQVGAANVNPDYSISIDVDFATDVPNCLPKHHGDVALGKGVVITRHLDSNRIFSDQAVAVAEENGIAHQISARRSATGGTNASKIQLANCGVRTLLLGIPNRYMHTPAEVCDLRDVESAVELIVKLVESISREQH